MITNNRNMIRNNDNPIKMHIAALWGKVLAFYIFNLWILLHITQKSLALETAYYYTQYNFCI